MSGDNLDFEEFLEPERTVEDDLFLKHRVPTQIPAPPPPPPPPIYAFHHQPISSSLPLNTAKALFPSPDQELVLALYKHALIVGTLHGNQIYPIASVQITPPQQQGYVQDVFGTESIQVTSTCDFTFTSLEAKQDCLRLFAYMQQRPFHCAVRGTLFSQVVLQEDLDLQRWNADMVNEPDQFGNTALHYACGMPLNPLLGSLLQDLKADPNSMDNDLATPLHVACRAGNAVAVVVLLRFGADVEVKDLHERTPFFVCAVSACAAKTEEHFEGYKRILESLVDAGSDAESMRDTEDRNALHYVAMEMSDEPFQLHTLRALLNAPCSMDVNSVSGDQQRTVLHLLACEKEFRSRDLFQLMIDCGARVNQGDAKGDTPLMLILRGETHYPFMTPDRRAIASLLVSQGGARLDVSNAVGVTPADASKVQRMQFDQELLQWKSKQEPTRIVQELVADSQLVLNLPRQCLVEQTANSCVGCRKPFSLMTWKTTCRRCGMCFCAQCTTKQVTLLSGQHSTSRETVCDACFSSYCASVSRLGPALLEVRKSREASSKRSSPAAPTTSMSASGAMQDMQSLWRAKEQLLGANNNDVQRAPPSAMEHTTSTVQRAKERLGERGERLQSVNDKTAKMKEDAENFASMATKLRKQQEQSMWPF